jgi:hypothetical protein
MNKNFTVKITKEECVGDSLAKHNFNFLSLDSVICNLSSLFFTSTNQNTPLWSTFYDLSTNKKNFDSNLSLMVNPVRFDRTYNGISMLSSYWSTQELTVEYEFNNSNKQNLIKDYFIYNTSKTFNSELTSKGLLYINEKFPPQNFINNTILNLVIPLYQNDGSIISKYTYNIYDAKTKTVIPKESKTVPVYEQIPSSRPNEEYRLVNGYFSKNDSNFGEIKTLRYKNFDNKWTFVNFLSSTCNNISNLKSSTIKNDLIVASNSKPLKIFENQWYNLKNYYLLEYYVTVDEKYSNLTSELTILFKNSQGKILTYPFNFVELKNKQSNTAVVTIGKQNISYFIGQDSKKLSPEPIKVWPTPYIKDTGAQVLFKLNTLENNQTRRDVFKISGYKYS